MKTSDGNGRNYNGNSRNYNTDNRNRMTRKERIRARKRRRLKKRIIRDSVLLLAFIILVLIIWGIVKLFSVMAGCGTSTDTKEKVTEKPTEPLTKVEVDVEALPEEYKECYKQIEQMESEHQEVLYLYKDFSSYPVDLLNLVIRNPETIGFVKDYLTKGSVDVIADVRDEYTPGEIPLFIQWDERWGYAKYGDNMIAINGCGPTCLAMVSVGLTGNTNYTPKYVANMSEQMGHYTESGTSWTLMSKGAEELGINGHSISINEQNIYDELKVGNPIIASMSPGDFTTEGHFIVITGIDKNNKLIVNDPNSKKRSKKHWDVNDIIKQTKSMWAYTV